MIPLPSLSLDRTFEGEIAFDATMNPLYRIVEDAVHLSDDVTTSLPDIPWHNIRGFRNIVAHGYWEIDRDAAWLIISDDIPVLAEALKSYQGDSPDQQPQQLSDLAQEDPPVLQ